MTTMRLEFFKQEDCRAEYTCQVIGLDSLGRDIVRTSYLIQQPSTAAASNKAGQKGWTPTVAMHLVDLAQELTTNMELMRSVIEDYRDRMTGVENKVAGLKEELSSAVVALEKGIDDNANRVELSLKSEFNLFENRISDKVASLEKELYKIALSQEGVNEKIDSTFTDRDSMATKLDNKIDKIAYVQSSFDSFEDKLKKEIKDLFQNELLPLGLNITKVADDFTTLESKMDLKMESLKQETKTCNLEVTANLENTLGQISLSSAEQVLSNITNSLSLLEKSMEGQFLELSSAINESNIESRSAAHKAVSCVNVSDSSEVTCILTDTSIPKTCKRGMVSLPTQPGYPYPVVQPSDDGSLKVPHLCDTTTDGGGWIVIQRRTSGDVDFYRTWADYKTGFGPLDNDFWLGNDNIHAITSSGDYELRVELRYDGKSAYAHYDKFAISDESGNYALTLGSYDGTAGDSLTFHAGKLFSTQDRDNDNLSAGNCAAVYTGAWWYSFCHRSNLNGRWGAGQNKGPQWQQFSKDKPVSFSEMKIRELLK